MNITHRSLWKMLGLMIITLGIYMLYWIVKTKRELNAAGAHIPTAWLFIIPLVNIYFLYKFSEAFSELILKDRNFILVYFLLIVCTLPLGILIYQAHMNTINQYPAQKGNL